MSEVNEIAFSNDLDQTYDFYGSYYTVNGEKYRNLLEIHSKINPPTDLYDAIVVMLNPGGSYPIDLNYTEQTFTSLITDLVFCEPDKTQYQIARLMNARSWNKVGVINLFDDCLTNSNAVVSKYKDAVAPILPSIFSDTRIKERKTIFSKIKTSSPIIIAWGVDEQIQEIKRIVLNTINEENNNKIVGYKNGSNNFYHPWPNIMDNDSSQSKKRKQNIRDKWPTVIYNQLIDANDKQL